MEEKNVLKIIEKYANENNLDYREVLDSNDYEWLNNLYTRYDDTYIYLKNVLSYIKDSSDIIMYRPTGEKVCTNLSPNTMTR